MRHRVFRRIDALARLLVAAIVIGSCSQSGRETLGPGSTPAASDAARPASAAPTTRLPVGREVTDDARMCDLLGPGDFELAGIAGAGLPEATSDGPGTAYCVFAGDSGATGGIELDAFVADDPADLYEVIRNEGTMALATHDVPGADAAEGWEGVAGEPASFARILVRSGRLVFALSAPGGPDMDDRLATLAALVVSRGSALTGD